LVALHHMTNLLMQERLSTFRSGASSSTRECEWASLAKLKGARGASHNGVLVTSRIA
jgi:hypothetical protein